MHREWHGGLLMFAPSPIGLNVTCWCFPLNRIIKSKIFVEFVQHTCVVWTPQHYLSKFAMEIKFIQLTLMSLQLQGNLKDFLPLRSHFLICFSFLETILIRWQTVRRRVLIILILKNLNWIFLSFVKKNIKL